MSKLSNVSSYVTEKISVDSIDISEYITTDNLLQNKKGRVIAEKLPSQKVTKFKKDDILIANIRPYLKKIWQADIEGGASSDVLVIRPNDLIDNNFLYYALTQDSFFEYVMKGSKGTKMPRGDKSQIMNFVIPDLDIDEQIKIGKLLKCIDQKIQINNQINQELEAMAKTLYDYWFVQFDFPDQNGKPYKSSGGKMVYHPELKREIPEGWGVEKLGDITICHDSKRVPLSSNDRELVKGEIPYYGATGIMDYVNDYIFDGDYVLMAEDGSVMTEKGTPILQRISGKNWVNNHAHVLEPIKNHSCKLLMMLLKDVSVMKIKTGSIQMKINQENMNKIVVPAIPLELLSEINQKLEVIDKQQLNLIEENHQTARLALADADEWAGYNLMFRR